MIIPNNNDVSITQKDVQKRRKYRYHTRNYDNKTNTKNALLFIVKQENYCKNNNRNTNIPTVI